MTMKVFVSSDSNFVFVLEQTGATLPPLCVPLPQFPALQFCAVFYNIKIDQNTGAHVCLNLEGQVNVLTKTTTLASISFDCVDIGPQMIGVSSPDYTRPSFVDFHLGKDPKITFFNSVAVGVIPAMNAPEFLQETTPVNLDFNLKPLVLN